MLLKRARIIYNPSAGRETFIKDLPMTLERLEIAGYEVSAHATTGAGDATEAAKIAVERKYDLLVVAGGDGTVNEVINGIAELENRPNLGLIPAGTTNDFARALSIPRDTKKALDIILAGELMLFDVGKINDKYFINMAGGGELTELTYDVPIQLKSMIGQLAYYIKGIEMLPFLRPSRVRIEYDGTVFDEELMVFLISNTSSVAGFEKLAPNAKVNDGYFDLIILKKVNLAEFIRIATLALRGAHIDDKNIVYAQAKRINIFPDDQLQLNIDGDFGGMLPGEVTNLGQHVKFFIPAKFIESQKDG